MRVGDPDTAEHEWVARCASSLRDLVPQLTEERAGQAAQGFFKVAEFAMRLPESVAIDMHTFVLPAPADE